MINFQLGMVCVCVGRGLSPFLLNFALEYAILYGSSKPGGAEI